MVLFKSLLQKELSELHRYLHSNMVLFKLRGANLNSADLRFTFQYGSIQMNTEEVFRKVKKIYIPIWFYSNEECDICGAKLDAFTFQYGSIQISFQM